VWTHSSFDVQGLRNDFKAALDKIEQEHLDEMTRQMVSGFDILYRKEIVQDH